VQATNKEPKGLVDNNTWTKVKVPRGVNTGGGKWALKSKHDERGSETTKKAGWVAKGCSQQAGCGCTETFAPVAVVGTLRTTVCAAAAEGWELGSVM